MTDFSVITACGECCEGCRKKMDGRCPGCIEADGRVPEWADSGRCRVHECTREHNVPFCGLCPEFPCEHLPSRIPWKSAVAEQMAALADEYRKTIPIVGNNYTGQWHRTRTACRGIVVRNGRMLLSRETVTGTWMLPGGGLEEGEDERGCCVREIAEETGFLIRPSVCVLEIDEYYGDVKWVNKYFFVMITGRTERKLTDREKEVGLESGWLPVDEAFGVFSGYDSCADEMKRGMYLREYTALCALMKRNV